MRMHRWALVGGLVLASGIADHRAPSQQSDDDLWPRERIEAALQAVEKARASGVTSDVRYRQKKAMLEQRMRGEFEGTALSDSDPTEINFIQNGGFEQINRNSAKNRSRWLWWGGWSWGGDYESFWAEAPNVHSGDFAAGIRCTGQTGRIGISTPGLPIVPGALSYELTLWAKGEGENELFINFEQGCSGTLRQRVPEEWTEIKVSGEPREGETQFMVYLYVTGAGTIYLDDVKLVPVGGEFGE